VVNDAFKRKLRIAVGAQTNAQANDICRRLAQDYPDVHVYRFAAAGATPIDLGPSVKWIWDKRDIPRDPCVVVPQPRSGE